MCVNALATQNFVIEVCTARPSFDYSADIAVRTFYSLVPQWSCGEPVERR